MSKVTVTQPNIKVYKNVSIVPDRSFGVSLDAVKSVPKFNGASATISLWYPK